MSQLIMDKHCKSQCREPPCRSHSSPGMNDIAVIVLFVDGFEEYRRCGKVVHSAVHPIFLHICSCTLPNDRTSL